MRTLLFLLLILLALLGHVLLWAAVVNRLHALGLRRWLIKSAMPLIGLAILLIPTCYAIYLLLGGFVPGLGPTGRNLWHPAVVYLVACWLMAAVTVAHLLYRKLLHRPPSVLRHHRTRLLDLAPHCTSDRPEEEHHFLVRMPGNESLQLDVAERALELERLPAALEGLSLVHLSDLHFTGRIGKAYFQELVRLANQEDPDLVVITGDLVDYDECIDWIPDTLSRLRSRSGNYFILGNHDLRVDTLRLRRVLVDSGLVDLGNRWQQVLVRETPVVLVGNEMPWFRPAPQLSTAPPPAPEGPLRIVLSHTPDQIGWARRHEADLMVAGHLHGGQIRLPLLGPLLAPSLVGVYYARAGVYHLPPTVLHMTRGVSGIQPIRFNCPPEIVRLLLHAPASTLPSPALRERGQG